jgi:hypothetical protein
MVLFLLVVLVQVAVPANEIASREMTLRTGTPVKFRTAPVDPADAFRGRYVWLSVAENSAPVPVGTTVRAGDRVYALIETDADGFARFTGLSATRPPSGLYLATTVTALDMPSAGAPRVRLDLPFDRFYLEESLAPEAERAYQQATAAGQQQAYIVVRLRDGQGVIEDLYIQDKPIRQILAERGA